MAEKKMWISKDCDESNTLNIWVERPVWNEKYDGFEGAHGTRIGCVGVSVLAVLRPDLHLPAPGVCIEVPERTEDAREELVRKLVEASQSLMLYEDSMDGAETDNDEGYWKAVQLARAALAAAAKFGYGDKAAPSEKEKPNPESARSVFDNDLDNPLTGKMQEKL